jgi:hypothetical protein
MFVKRALLVGNILTRAIRSSSAGNPGQVPIAANCSTASPQEGLNTIYGSNMTRAAVISISHGGGPMPVLGDPGSAEIVRSLKNRVPEILKLNTNDAPRAIVLVTAHWEEQHPTISSGKKPRLYYDYGGFPREAYELKYDAPGSPEVAKEVEQVFKEAGLRPRLNEGRGSFRFFFKKKNK